MGMGAHGSIGAALGLCVALEVCAAAVLDARTRQFPNGLALVLACSCGCLCLVEGGAAALMFHVASALIACALLIAFEVAWRRFHRGVAGLGGGDIKFLAGFMLWDPSFAVISFTAGLVLLAVAGSIGARRSLPLLPFVAAAAAAVLVLP